MSALPLLTLSGSVRGLYGSGSDDPALDPYGAGLGLRAGVTLPASLYVGASLDYFFGESSSVAGLDSSASLLQLLAQPIEQAGTGIHGRGLRDLVPQARWVEKRNVERSGHGDPGSARPGSQPRRRAKS